MSAIPPLVTADVYEIKTHGTQGAGGSSVTPAGNVFYYRKVSGGVVTLTQLITAFRTAVVVPHIAAANARYHVNSISARKVNDVTDPGVTVTDAGVGAIATDAEPSENCAVVNYITQFRGKAGRGFKHFAGVNEADTTLDVLTGGGLTAWQAVRDGAKANITDASGNVYTPFILSKTNSQIKSTPTKIFGVDVTSAKLNTVVAELRKRKAIPVLS